VQSNFHQHAAPVLTDGLYSTDVNSTRAYWWPFKTPDSTLHACAEIYCMVMREASKKGQFLGFAGVVFVEHDTQILFHRS